MIILKHGKPKTHVFHCDNCGCEFEAEEKEWTTWFEYDLWEENTRTIKCPDCGYLIEEELPPQEKPDPDALRRMTLSEDAPSTLRTVYGRRMKENVDTGSKAHDYDS